MHIRGINNENQLSDSFEEESKKVWKRISSVCNCRLTDGRSYDGRVSSFFEKTSNFRARYSYID